jgi:hypothetical protein
MNYCVVCGRGSLRSSWNNQIIVGATTYVACDFHSLAEFMGSIQSVVRVGANDPNQDPSIDESPAT